MTPLERQQSTLICGPESGTMTPFTKAAGRRANAPGHGTEGITSMRDASYAHTGDPLEELEIRCVGPSREYGRRRTTHYGVCRCGWQSQRRASSETVAADYRRHVEESK